MTGKIDISPGFLLLAAGNLLWMEGKLGAGVLAAYLIHEGMHLLSLSFFGGRLRRLRLTASGARILTEQGSMGYGGELLSVMAGPGINLLLALVLAGAGERWYLFSGIQLAVGAFNLLPIPGLDGWRMITLLLLMLINEDQGIKAPHISKNIKKIKKNNWKKTCNPKSCVVKYQGCAKRSITHARGKERPVS